ncbi:lysR family transcriptional regulator [Bordetella ansorpii]|uniref:LysR family transcriptional regulator n=2 Tax=Bordetella ansorpii TaxID=288768 RepID=A0A157MVX3_9BORD|nr:lysR family transcriptional regulator [Bordetella ansorpii]
MNAPSDLPPSLTSPLLDDSRVTLDQLRTFVAIIDSGSFHQAALVLHRSQSAVTQKLQQLESALGHILLARKQGRITDLTDAGERFLPGARDILRRVSATIQTTRRASVEGVVRLGVPEDALPRIAPTLASMDWPGLQLQVQTGSSQQLLRDLHQKLDLIIFKQRESAPLPPMAQVLETEDLCWAAPRDTGFDITQAVPLVTSPDGYIYRQCALEALAQANRKWTIVCASANIENVHAAISAGLGIGVLPRRTLAMDQAIATAALNLPALPNLQLAMVTADANNVLATQVAARLKAAWKE